MKVKTKSFMISVLMLIAFVFGVFAFMPTTTMAKADESEYVPVTEFEYVYEYQELALGSWTGAGLTIKPDNATNKNVIYTSSDYNIAIVDPMTGRITGMSEGTAIITATLKDGENIFTATMEVKVIDGCGRCDGVFFVLGNDEQIAHSVQNGSKPRFPEVKKDGYVFLGWYEDSAYLNPWDMENGVTKTANNTYIYAKWIAEGDYVAPNGLVLSETAVSIYDSTSKTITASVQPADATHGFGELVWSVEDESIVEIDGKNTYATYKGLKEGTTTITVSTKDGVYSASCVVKVEDTHQIRLDKKEWTTYTDDVTFRLEATITSTSLGNVEIEDIEWTTDKPDIVQVSPIGGVKNAVNFNGLKEGKAVITATATTKFGKQISASCTVYVESDIVSGWDICVPKYPGQAVSSNLIDSYEMVNATVTQWIKTGDGGGKLNEGDLLEDGVTYVVKITITPEGRRLFPIFNGPTDFDVFFANCHINGVQMTQQFSHYANGETRDTQYEIQITFTAEPHTHTYDGWTNNTAGSHFKACTDPNCPAYVESMIDLGEHQFGEVKCTDTVAICTVCQGRFDTVGLFEHNFGEWQEEIPATCSSTGTKAHQDCSVCKKHFNEYEVEIADLTLEVNANNHSFGQWQEEIPATCQATGTRAHKDCIYCNKHFAENGITEIAILKIDKDMSNHTGTAFTYTTNNNGTHKKVYACCGTVEVEYEVCSGGNATCTAKAICEKCETAYGDTLTHTPKVEWENNETHHWHDCTGCSGQELEKATHTPDRANATETDPIKCTICEYIITPALGHTTHTPKVEWESDENNHWHDCTGCEGQQLEKAAHTDENTDGKCDTCGKDMPTTPDEPKDGLGTGAIIGIVVGGVAVVGIGGFAIFWFVIKKKKQ